jgi:hypothetical protein
VNSPELESDLQELLAQFSEHGLIDVQG